MLDLLYVDWNFNPVMIPGRFEIRYYGLMWVMAIFIGAKFFDKFCKREGLPQKVSDSIFIYGTLATILGARFGHCLFYEPMEYLPRPWTIITGFRDGGLASHGAALGMMIGLWLFSRRNKLPYLWSLDRITIPVGIGGALVRFGNLFNSEIFGCETTLPWGFRFLRTRYADMVCHPTQIYEALFYLATFAILCVMYYRNDLARRRPGVMFGVCLIGIFVSRILVEFLKFDQVEFEANMLFNMGQWLSVPFVILGGYMVWRGYSRPEQKVNVKR